MNHRADPDGLLVGVVNAGSSSLKFAVYEGEQCILSGQVEGIGVHPSGKAKGSDGQAITPPDLGPLDHDPRNGRQRNLRSLCQRCHLTHDRAWHLLQRWITYRLRFACGDLFLGTYRHGREAAAPVSEILARIAERLSHKGSECHRLAPGSGGVESAPLLI